MKPLKTRRFYISPANFASQPLEPYGANGVPPADFLCHTCAKNKKPQAARAWGFDDN